MKKKELKDWLLAGVFTVTLWAALAALFYYLEDLIAGLVVVLLFITVSSITMSGFYFLEKKRKSNRVK